MLLQGDRANAVREYQRAVSVDSDNWNAWGNLAAALGWNGVDTPQSVLAYNKAAALGEAQLKTTPDDPFLISVWATATLHCTSPRSRSRWCESRWRSRPMIRTSSNGLPSPSRCWAIVPRLWKI